MNDFGEPKTRQRELAWGRGGVFHTYSIFTLFPEFRKKCLLIHLSIKIVNSVSAPGPENNLCK